MKKFLLFVLIVALCVAGLYCWKNYIQPAQTTGSFTPAPNVGAVRIERSGLIAHDDEMTKLVESVVPSVVSITTTSRRAPYQAMPEAWKQFFGVQDEQPRIGSGVIVSKQGHILTNTHIVANMDDIKVQLNDGRTLPAKIIGADERSDIAVLKIDAPDLKPLALGDSDKVKVGQLVFAIGSPFGLDESVSMGIISAKGRRAADDTAREFFQTDTAINPGNSGGPLVNVRGEIIGINSSIYSGSGGWQGIGFAIPANAANRVLQSLIKNGRVIRGYFGVSIQQLTPVLARQFNLPTSTGGIVLQIAPGSPAEKAGLQRGDIILKFGNLAVSDSQEFRNRVADAPIGSKIEISVLRNNRVIQMTVEICEQPAGFRTGGPVSTPDSVSQHPTVGILSGVKVADIPADHRSFMPENVTGVLITAIDPASPAAQALQPGDVIEEINAQPVATTGEFEHLARIMNPADKQILFICRGNARLFVVMSH